MNNINSSRYTAFSLVFSSLSGYIIDVQNNFKDDHLTEVNNTSWDEHKANSFHVDSAAVMIDFHFCLYREDVVLMYRLKGKEKSSCNFVYFLYQFDS